MRIPTTHRSGTAVAATAALLLTGLASVVTLGAAAPATADGATVTICGRTEARLRKAAHGTPLRWRVCDVTDEEQVQALFDETGAVDVLVNNAGLA